MAVQVIAAAPSGGKGAHDRAEILRTAHRAARDRMSPSSSWRHGDRYDPEIVGWMPKHSYREAFASALRSAWRDAKVAAEEAAYEASLPSISADIADRIHELQAAAWASPITMRGNAMHAALLDQARDRRRTLTPDRRPTLGLTQSR